MLSSGSSTPLHDTIMVFGIQEEMVDADSSDFGEFEFDDSSDFGIMEDSGDILFVEEDEIDRAFNDAERDLCSVIELDYVKGYVFPVEKLLQVFCKEIYKIHNICEVNTDSAAALLYHFKWDTQRLMEEYFEDPDNILKLIGLTVNEDRNTLSSSYDNQECLVCFMENDGRELSCGHKFCLDCWNSYLNIKINEGNAVGIPCMARDCCRIVDEETIRMNTNDNLFRKYLTFILHDFVNLNPYLKWCPAKNCGKVIKSETQDKPFVMCSCGQKFCFVCSLEAHSPSDCSQMKKWEIKMKEDNGTSEWILGNTKSCPHCLSPIEKNGGCNHMTCKKCYKEVCKHI
eukprot:TRINITY_DN1254_c0_g1_i1.p1 TRINITY_DN1254_c0_g1~~TRINITY_DN1254_c0_g1_i1.p1  ORF type:complete len:343 (-),score=62.10 TRINITY_DN1254_c0_g1_i1:576-1604(-)